MIPRYSRPEMAALWSPERRYQLWLEIELAACDAMAAEGLVPAEDARACRDKAPLVDAGAAARIDEIEKVTRHDVIAFLTWIEERIGPPARHLHRGMTSSDVLDTALALQLKGACMLLDRGLTRALAAIERRAFEHKDTPCVGRSHGIHAEPTTFGLKLAGWFAELRRGQERLQHAARGIAVGKISGAVGTYSNLPPSIERRTLDALGLGAEDVSTQVVARDRHAELFSALALVGASLERFAVEIRHLQRTEVREAEEPFTAGQKGSSAMPHKRNPILSENLTGLARLLRANAIAALENVALWHERDISHSSVERVIAPDCTIALDFMLSRFAGLVDGLRVYPARMLENLALTRGLVFSQAVLLALIERANLGRQAAYALVQRSAMRVWDEGADFQEALAADPEVAAYLPPAVLAECFDLKRELRHVDDVFRRVFGRTA